MGNTLKSFTNKAIPTGVVLGMGAFGKVEEMRLCEKIVAGKIYQLSVNDDCSMKKFSSEVIILAQIRHPNIVEFEGVCQLPGVQLPIILMERLNTNLHSYILDPSHENLCHTRKICILRDIANGLLHLHSLTPPLVHRDLTAKNVLLDSREIAKIADFGNAKILDIDPESSNMMTSRPGTLEYMPPEAFGICSEYDTSLDVFSFGHLSLFVAIQESPTPSPFFGKDTTGRKRYFDEVERRSTYIAKAEQQLGKKHCILTIIIQCLESEAHDRPATSNILERLDEKGTIIKKQM